MKTILRSGQAPLVSIIIPVFNKCDLTMQCLKALAEVTNHLPHEILVVDNASSDATPQLAQNQPPHIRYLRNEVNRNFAGACNQGAAAASGKYLLFLNNDTIPVRGWLDALLDEFRQHPQVAVAGAKLIYLSGLIQHAGVGFLRETRNPFHLYSMLRKDDPRVNRRRELQAVTAACFLIRPKWFHDCGGFSEDFRNGYEDLDLCLKVRQRGGVIAYQPKSVVYHLESRTPGRMKFDNENRALFFQRWSRAVLSDEDAHYFADGYYRIGHPERPPEKPHLVRFSDEAERNQWRRVALSQTLAAQWQRRELINVVSDDTAWPREASVRRWAGCLAQRLGLRDVAQRHFAAAQALEENDHVRLLMAPATMPSASDSGRALSVSALQSGFKALQDANFDEAGHAFELALIQGASPNMALTGLWQVNELRGAAVEAQGARQALQNLARLNPGTSRRLTGGAAQTVATVVTAAPTHVASAPQVSIVVPVFNNLALTRSCLDSLARVPSEIAREIVIVDNASSDGTTDYLSELENTGAIRLISNARNEGFARACNQGARAARGSLLLFLNNDTQVTPGYLEAMVQAAAHPDVGVVGAKLLYADDRIQHAGIGFIKGVPDHPYRHAPTDAPEANQYRELDMVTGACLMIHRELFLQLAGFDETYRNGVEDIDLCLRVRATNRKVVYEPKAVVYHLEGQSAGRFDHVAENLRLFFERWSKSFDSRTNFVVPNPTRVFTAGRSLLAEKAKPINVHWRGSFLDHGSLSHVNREMTQALLKLKDLTLSRISNGSQASPAFDALSRDISMIAAGDADITVRHAWPPQWTRPQSGKLVVIQPWEFGALPKSWVKNSFKVDEFWVPSEYVRLVYVESGVPSDKVQVVPNGVDPGKFHPQVTPMKLVTQKKFKFLFVGGTIHRKGPDLLLQAFLDSFTAADDVCLVIKDFGGQSVYQGQTFEEEIAAARLKPDAPEILYLTDELPSEAMPRLYAACQCLVHPYRGEGFGLPVLEAMACGLPVVVTGGGATDDFATDEYAYRLPALRRPIGDEISGIKLVHNGWFLEPVRSALSERLRWIVAHPDEARTLGRAASDYVRREWTWECAARIASLRLQDLAARKKAEAAAAACRARKAGPISLPAVAKIGDLAPARQLLAGKDLAAAWNAATAALQSRPYHPEAWLLLAEIAKAAGDGSAARRCAQRASGLAPEWNAPRQFLKAPQSSLAGRAVPCTPSDMGRGVSVLPPSCGGQGTARPAFLYTSKIDALSDRPPRLSVCLIVKNEEEFLGRCLASVRQAAWQIIVVDTGSTDRTVEIAKEHGAEVHHIAWCDDFSAARNAALEHATGDWILSLDADEELPAGQQEILRREMQDASVLGCRIQIIDKGREQDGCNYVPRLFRNAPGLFFVGRVHEQAFSSLQARCRQWGLKNVLGRTALLHHGYSAEVTSSRNKNGRNLRLLELAMEESPNDPNLLMNHGLELVRSGQLQAGLEQYIEALHCLAAQPPSGVAPELREALLTQLTSHLMAAKCFEQIVQVWRMPVAKAAPLTASQHFSLGLAFMELKRHAEAAEQMRQCLAKRGQPCLSPVNAEIRKAGPNHCLALCLDALGEKEAAARAFAAALADGPSSRRAGYDFARFEAERGRPLDALKQLNRLAAENPGEAPVWQLGGRIALSRPEFLEFARDWTGEAVKHFPEHPELSLQRAEALLLTQDPEGALGFWRKTPPPRSSRQTAAMVLCELLTDGCRRHFPAAEEAQVSRELVKWYRSLIAAGAHASVRQLHERMEQAREVAPGFAAVWDAATQQARQNARGTLVPA